MKRIARWFDEELPEWIYCISMATVPIVLILALLSFVVGCQIGDIISPTATSDQQQGQLPTPTPSATPTPLASGSGCTPDKEPPCAPGLACALAADGVMRCSPAPSPTPTATPR